MPLKLIVFSVEIPRKARGCLLHILEFLHQLAAQLKESSPAARGSKEALLTETCFTPRPKNTADREDYRLSGNTEEECPCQGAVSIKSDLQGRQCIEIYRDGWLFIMEDYLGMHESWQCRALIIVL